MFWDKKMNKAVKTRDTVVHEDSFPDVGEISQPTTYHWVLWDTKTSTLLKEGIVFANTLLYKRRLSNSIHNTLNPVNNQASRIPLPPPTDEEVDLLREDSPTPVFPISEPEQEMPAEVPAPFVVNYPPATEHLRWGKHIRK